MRKEDTLFDSDFDSDKCPLRQIIDPQQGFDESNQYFSKNNSEHAVRPTSNIITALKRPNFNSERDEASFRCNNNYLYANYNGDYSRCSNISGLSDDANVSLMSFHKADKKKTGKFFMCKSEQESFEINQPAKTVTKINPIVIDYSKTDGRDLEFIHTSNSRPPLPKLEISRTSNYIDANTIPNAKSEPKLEESKKDNFYFSFDKDAVVENNISERVSKKQSSENLSFDVQSLQKKHTENTIENSRSSFTKKKVKSKKMKEINILEAIMNTETEMRITEDTEINKTSFNNDKAYVKSFPFSNSPLKKNLIFHESFEENYPNRNSINYMDKNTTTLSGSSDVSPFLENQQSRDLKRKKETMKIKEIIHSFGDTHNKNLQIEDKKEYSNTACNSCTKQCLVF